MGLDALGDFLVDGLGIGGRAEGAVVHVAPGAAGDLGQFGRGQVARDAAVELAGLGEGDMVDVHVQAHADGVGGDQIVDLAGLVHGDLGVAGARAQGAEHHGGAAAVAADHLGDGIDVGGREGDHRRAGRQTGDLARTGVGQGREPGPGLEGRLGDQAAEQWLHRLGAHEHGLAAAAGMQQAVGEDVAAVGIGAHLDLVDAEKGDRAVDRHGLDGAQEVAGGRRDDLLLAGDQGDLAGAPQRHRAVVVLARQQAQRKADHARLMAEHPLHGEVRLTRIGGAQDGDDAGSARRDLHSQKIAALRADCNP